MDVKTEKLIILVDMDNTICDLDGALISALSQLSQATPAPGPVVDWQALIRQRSHFELDSKTDELAREIMLKPGFFANLDPMEGAVGALLELEKRGYHVVLCTSAIRESEHCVADKCAWVRRHLGPRWDREKLTISKDKTLIRGKILIDDRPEQPGCLVPSWQHVVYHQSYNSQVEGKPRLRSWQDALVMFPKRV